MAALERRPSTAPRGPARWLFVPTRQHARQLANGNVGAFVNTLNTLTTGTGSANNGAVLRRAGFPENYIVVNPQYSGVSMLNNLGNSTYHSLQLQFTRRLSHGFTNTTTWTWSKALGDSDTDTGSTYRDPTNRSIEKTNLGFDHAHQLTSNGTYELPFGTGRLLLGNAPGWVQQIVAGWQLGGIMNYNSGVALSITSGVSTISTCGAQPNIVGALPKDMGKVTKVSNGVVYFDGFTQIQDPGFANVTTLNGLSTAYNNRAIVDPSGQIVLVNPQPGEVGTLGYSTVKGPGSLGFDMNIIKRFRIHETQGIRIPAGCNQRVEPSELRKPEHGHQRQQYVWPNHDCRRSPQLRSVHTIQLLAEQRSAGSWINSPARGICAQAPT